MFDKSIMSQLPNLKTEALVELKVKLVEMFKAARTQELSVSGVAELAELTGAIESIQTELASREADSTQTQSELAKQVAELASTITADPAPAAEHIVEVPAPAELAAEEPAPAVDSEPVVAEPVAAPAELAAVVDLSPAGLPSDPVVGAERSAAAIVAGSDIPGMTAGSPLPTMRNVAEAIITRRQTLRGSAAGNGDKVIIASAHGVYPEDRRLGNAIEENLAKLERVTSPDALVASGGLCAPLEPYYGLQVISNAARPVRDGLPKFMADRGGVRFIPPPKLSDVSSAIAVTTATQDAVTYGEGEGETPFKPCLHVTCGTEDTAEIAAVSRCLTFGNFAARTFPEQVEAWLALVLAAHARRAETLLIDAIDAASTATTATATYSAARTLLPQIDQAVAGYKSRNRTGNSIMLRILLPDWSKELLRADLARSYQGAELDPLAVTDVMLLDWFRVRNVEPTFYLDGPTGGGQVFGAQAAGALTPFPSTVVWYLYVEGSFVFLDGGTLDLGIVRDSTLNTTNDYNIFAETFENVAFFGVESIKVTSDVCPNGVSAPAVSGSAPC